MYLNFSNFWGRTSAGGDKPWSKNGDKCRMGGLTKFSPDTRKKTLRSNNVTAEAGERRTNNFIHIFYWKFEKKSTLFLLQGKGNCYWYKINMNSHFCYCF